MIPKECKRLAEVDFPIAVVGIHSLAEKARRTGTPHQLHLWWAWRPLAACRAIMLSLLLPDPCDPLCPLEFKHQARELLPSVSGRVGSQDIDLRRALLKFVGDFASWNQAADPAYLKVGRGLVKAAHGDDVPLIVDPFAGGGSIPMEALRLGCETFASDLNPVACLILKTKLQDIPRQGSSIAENLIATGATVNSEVGRRLAICYPPDQDGSHPIAYLWARTVRCEAPNCGAEIPLVRSFWLSKKGRRNRALRPKVIRVAGQVPRVEFEIFEPKNDREVPSGTVNRAKAACLCCPTVLPAERVRSQLEVQRGGADVIFGVTGQRVGGAQLLAVVTVKPGEQGRRYRLPTILDYKAVHRAQEALTKTASG